MRIDQYIKARDSLMEKDLIAFNSTLFQVLELPAKPIRNLASEPVDNLAVRNAPEVIDNIIKRSFKGS